jgi:hypothetical protein
VSQHPEPSRGGHHSGTARSESSLCSRARWQSAGAPLVGAAVVEGLPDLVRAEDDGAIVDALATFFVALLEQDERERAEERPS